VRRDTPRIRAASLMLTSRTVISGHCPTSSTVCARHSPALYGPHTRRSCTHSSLEAAATPPAPQSRVRRPGSTRCPRLAHRGFIVKTRQGRGHPEGAR
jgi:hypothetical protein